MEFETNQSTESETILEVDSLNVEYSTPTGAVQAVRDASLRVEAGETIGIAGESGSGKSTLALAILQYLGTNGKITSGSVRFNGMNLRDLSRNQLQSLRGNRIAHVAQDANRALNPSLTVGEQIAETVRKHQNVSKKEARKQSYEKLADVDIPDPEYSASKYPHELSGGQQQRVLTAIALSCNPDLLVLDEPTTGLDVTTQVKIIDLINDLKDEYNTTVLIITHNLEILAQITDRVAIMYAGELMETGPVDRVFQNPTNPYTQGLIAATPELGSDTMPTKTPGQVPSLIDIPDGCVFVNRCKHANEECHGGTIEMEIVDSETNHHTRCHRWEIAADNYSQDASGRRIEQTQAGSTLLEASNVRKEFDQPTTVEKFLSDSAISNVIDINPSVKAINGIDISINESEAVGLVGESGSGKSTLGEVLLQLLNPSDGQITFRGGDLTDLEKFYSECQVVFQNPHSSLNPRKTVYQTLEKPLKILTDLDKSERSDRISELLREVDLGPDYMERYPHELSGGEKQRVAIARAFAPEPSLVLLDEPTSALDVSVQANILNLLSDLKQEYGTAYIFISHDLSVISTICDRVLVMYLGEVVESGTREEIFSPPYHPYTRALLSSIPSLDPDTATDPIKLEGDLPSNRNLPNGCPFHSRCPQKIGDVCESSHPDLESVSEAEVSTHSLSCHLEKEELDRDIPHVESLDRRED